MAPERRGGGGAGPEPRLSAVLVLLYPAGAGLAFPLILRDGGLRAHAGQVGLPGGALEPGEAAEEAALRETEEEIGAEARAVRILGALSELAIPATGFRVRPFVGFARERPPLSPRPGEVERILESPLDAVLDPRFRATEIRVLHGAPARVPFFRIGGEKVWGATAMILSELAAVLSRAEGHIDAAPGPVVAPGTEPEPISTKNFAS